MVVSLKRMLKSYSESSRLDLDDLQQDSNHKSSKPDADAHSEQRLPPIQYPSDTHLASGEGTTGNQNDKTERNNQQLRAKRVVEAVAEVNNYHSPTPLTDRYLTYKKNYRHPSRPPFDAATMWTIKHGNLPIMTELIDVVDETTLSAMPIEAVAILDRINGKLKRYREWSSELSGEQEKWVCERQYVIDKLIKESIPEAIHHYEQLQKFSPHRTKNNKVEDNMTAADLLTDLFIEIDYELDELLDELHEIVINRLATTRRYVKSRTQN